jgi:hypothetical protein
MIRTSITPTNNNCLITIPTNYIGKELEVFIYAKDELIFEKNSKKSSSSRFKGILTIEEANNYQKHISKSRLEWERDI